jgi:hypothetical protein
MTEIRISCAVEQGLPWQITLASARADQTDAICFISEDLVLNSSGARENSSLTQSRKNWRLLAKKALWESTGSHQPKILLRSELRLPCPSLYIP